MKNVIPCLLLVFGPGFGQAEVYHSVQRNLSPEEVCADLATNGETSDLELLLSKPETEIEAIVEKIVTDAPTEPHSRALFLRDFSLRVSNRDLYASVPLEADPKGFAQEFVSTFGAVLGHRDSVGKFSLIRALEYAKSISQQEAKRVLGVKKLEELNDLNALIANFPHGAHPFPFHISEGRRLSEVLGRLAPETANGRFIFFRDFLNRLGKDPDAYLRTSLIFFSDQKSFGRELAFASSNALLPFGPDLSQAIVAAINRSEEEVESLMPKATETVQRDVISLLSLPKLAHANLWIGDPEVEKLVFILMKFTSLLPEERRRAMSAVYGVDAVSVDGGNSEFVYALIDQLSGLVDWERGRNRLVEVDQSGKFKILELLRK